MKVVAYTRVSTDKQAEEGLGLDVQRDAIRAWAKSLGHKVVDWTSDEGVSGSNGLDDRTGLFDAFNTIRTGRAKGLVIYRLDRLSRDLIVQEQLLAELWRLGAVGGSSASKGRRGHRAGRRSPPLRSSRRSERWNPEVVRQLIGRRARV